MIRINRREKTERNVEVQITKGDLIRLLRIAHEAGEPDVSESPDDDEVAVVVTYHSEDGKRMLQFDGDDVLVLSWKEVEER